MRLKDASHISLMRSKKMSDGYGTWSGPAVDALLSVSLPKCVLQARHASLQLRKIEGSRLPYLLCKELAVEAFEHRAL